MDLKTARQEVLSFLKTLEVLPKITSVETPQEKIFIVEALGLKKEDLTRDSITLDGNTLRISYKYSLTSLIGLSSVDDEEIEKVLDITLAKEDRLILEITKPKLTIKNGFLIAVFSKKVDLQPILNFEIV